METRNDFSKGSVVKNIWSLAVPMTVAQLVNVLYSVVDRVYIGHLPHTSTEALTGIGLALPVITMITAFSNLFGMGGAPLCSIARGAGDGERAEKIMGNSFTMLLLSGAALMAVCYLTMKPMLFLFGASVQTYPYAKGYLSVYLLGTLFVMISLGMNNFINAQGFGKMGMITVDRSYFEYYSGSGFYFYLPHGRLRGGDGNRDLSGGVSALCVLVSEGRPCLVPAEAKDYAAGRKVGSGNHRSWPFWLCHVCYQWGSADRM